MAEESDKQEFTENLIGDNMDVVDKVLFPETHIETVEILGKERSLRPIPVKYSRILQQQLAPTARSLEEIMRRPEGDLEDVTDSVAKAIHSACLTLAQFYAWEDVAAALTMTWDESLLTMGEQQDLCKAQVSLSRDNDFLLGPLRVILAVMAVQELATNRFLSLSTSQLLSSDGASLFENSSSITPPAKSSSSPTGRRSGRRSSTRSTKSRMKTSASAVVDKGKEEVPEGESPSKK